MIPFAPPKPKPVDREWLREQLAKLDAEGGPEYIPGITPEEARRFIEESMRASGIDPDSLYYPQDEDNPDEPYPDTTKLTAA